MGTVRKHRPKVAAECYNVTTFCKDHAISRALYYELRKQGLGPREKRLGRSKVLITKEAAAAWREK